MKKMNKKAFTLMEMLIVVAIIGILVVIAIPMVTSSTESAKEATDKANLRTAKSQALIRQTGSEELSGDLTYDAETGFFSDQTGFVKAYEGQSKTNKGLSLTCDFDVSPAICEYPSK